MKNIKYVENTVLVRIRTNEYEIACTDERDSDVSIEEFTHLDWISWRDAVGGAEIMGLKEFTLNEVRALTIDDDGEILAVDVIGYHNPSHLIKYDKVNGGYEWEPMAEVKYDKN